MADRGLRRWRPSVSTMFLGAGVALTVLSYLWPAGGWGKGAAVTFLGLCLVGVWAGARMDRRRLEREIRQQALYDPLTQLPNRTLFLDRVDHAVAGTKRRGRPVAVLVVDLDGFNSVNDAFGQSAGDRVLVEVGQRLRGCLRAADSVARLDGDEFAMLLVDAGIPEATQVADRVLDRLGAAFPVQGREVIVDMDRWVTAEACRQLRSWQQRFPSEQPLAISVNISARQLQDPDLLRDVRAAVEAFGLDPASLTLEITETVLMQDTEATISVLRALRGLGVRLAIDDFGIGFSSLSYLR